MSEDQHLLQKLHYGDCGALRTIYEKYKDDLLTIALSVLRDIHAAEDCLHDVFVKFADSASDSCVRGSLKGYLITCIINRARDQLRKSQNTLVCHHVEKLDCPTTLNGPLGQAIETEESARVFEVLAKLPDEQHEVIVMHLYGKMKFKEIARHLDISINTVQSRYRYGIEKLRTLL